MKAFCKKIIYLTIAFSYSLKWLILFIVRTHSISHVEYKKRTHKLKILANGPSLSDSIKNLDLSNSETMVVNNFYLSEYFTKLCPKYYVIADPLFFTSTVGMDLVKALEELVNWNMTLLIPREQNNQYFKIANPMITITRYNSGDFRGFKIFEFYLFKKGLAMPSVQNVTIACIFLGINLGYKRIELYGMEHSWTKNIRVNNNNEVCLTDGHFYDKAAAALKPWKNVTGKTFEMDEILRTLAVVFESHKRLKKYADYRGCKIINKTPNSFIDSYERDNNL